MMGTISLGFDSNVETHIVEYAILTYVDDDGETIELECTEPEELESMSITLTLIARALRDRWSCEHLSQMLSGVGPLVVRGPITKGELES